MESSKTTVEACKCLRCGHVWVSRLPAEREPKQCAKCRSLLWDVPPPSNTSGSDAS